MSLSSREIAACAAGALISAVVWFRVVPFQAAPVISPATPVTVDGGGREVWAAASLKHLCDSLENGSTAGARLKAAESLEQIPIGEIPAALDTLTSPKDFELSLSAKLLLVRWGRANGESAARWAWNRFTRPETWEDAFRQVAPAWESRNPLDFGKWALETASFVPYWNSGAKRSAGDRPVMSGSLLHQAAECLVRDKPGLAFQAELKSNSLYYVKNLAAALQSIPEIREALSVLEPLEKALPSGDSASLDPFAPDPAGNLRHGFAQALLERWKQIDAADFSHSEYAAMVSEPPLSGP